MPSSAVLRSMTCSFERLVRQARSSVRREVVSWSLGIGLFLLSSITGLAQGLSASTPSKEYIYVGGKLVVTDEPAAAQSPVIAISPSPLAFNGVAGGANPSSQSLSITNIGAGTLSWTGSSNQSWLTVSPAGGSAPSSPTVNVNLAGLAAGTNNAQLTVTSTGASNTPQTVSVTLTVSPAAAVPTALFVVGSTTLNSGDAAVKTRLEALGYTVTVKTGSSATTADATGKALVLISSTVTPSQVNTKFRAVTTPVLNWESDLFDDLGMTGSGSSNLGTLNSQTQLSIVTPSHPLAAGLSGTVTVVSASGKFTWGAPNANGLKIATQVGNSSKSVIFGYETGVGMPGLTAPGRRVGVFLEDTTAASLTSQAGTLFDAAIQWAAGALAAPVSLTATPGNQLVSLQWSAVTGAASYRVKRGTSASGPFNLVGSNLTGTTYADSNLTNGTTYYYVVTAINSSGLESANSTVASATPALPDLTPPSINLTSPSNGATISGAFSLSASASDNVAVTRVRFYLDGAAIGSELTSAPYSLLWDSTALTNGNHTIAAQAWDAANNQASSAVFTITVSNPVSTPPVVSVTYPTASSVLAANISVQGLVDQTSDVQLKVDGINHGGPVAAASSYGLTFETRTVPNGNHTLSVEAATAQVWWVNLPAFPSPLTIPRLRLLLLPPAAWERTRRLSSRPRVCFGRATSTPPRFSSTRP